MILIRNEDAELVVISLDDFVYRICKKHFLSIFFEATNIFLGKEYSSLHRELNRNKTLTHAKNDILIMLGQERD